MVQVRPDGPLARAEGGWPTPEASAQQLATATAYPSPGAELCPPEGAGSTAAGGPLDLHEAIADVRVGCARWPEALRLRNERTGELVRGRCKATNQCEYCERIAAVETVEMLMLDAMEDAPTVLVVLTARELLTRADCRDHLQLLKRQLKEHYPDIRWAVLVEFQRRGALHLNLLVKGVSLDALEAFRGRIVGRWCQRVDAEPVGQWVGEVTAAGGLIRYVALHFLKPEQAPPRGWRGHRFSCSRDYFATTAAVMRRRAREALQLKRELHKLRAAGHEAHDAELLARQALEEHAAAAWVLANRHGARIGPVCVDRRRMLTATTATEWAWLFRIATTWDRPRAGTLNPPAASGRESTARRGP